MPRDTESYDLRATALDKVKKPYAVHALARADTSCVEVKAQAYVRESQAHRLHGTRNWTLSLSGIASGSVLSSASSMSDADDGSEKTDRQGGCKLGRDGAGCWLDPGHASGVNVSAASSPQQKPEACKLFCSFVSANCRSYSSRSFSRDSCSTRMRVTRKPLRLASQARNAKHVLMYPAMSRCGNSHSKPPFSPVSGTA